MRSITGVGLCVLLVLCGDFGFGQVTRLDPAEPAWGDTLTVTYDTEAEEAVLTGVDDIYALCRLVYSDHAFKEFSVQLEKKGSRYLHSIPVEEGLAYVDFSFFSFESVDARAFTTKGILRSDGRRARQGAYLNTIRFSDDPEEEFRKEIELYPDNYIAYKERWFTAMRPSRRDEGPPVDVMIKADMKKLQSVTAKRSPEMLFALSFGHLFLLQEEEGQQAFKELLDEYPQSPLVYPVVRNLRIHAFDEIVPDEEMEDVNRVVREYVRNHPETRTAREELHSTERTALDLSTIQNVCREWIADEPDNPLPYSFLAEAYEQNKTDEEEANRLIDRSIDLLLRGQLQLHGDISGAHARHHIPSAYAIKAKLSLSREAYGEALSAIKAAQALESETNPWIYDLEGQIWETIKNDRRAETAYLEAWKKGSQKAENSLRALYERRHGTLEGFAIQPDLPEQLGETREGEAAPAFEVRTLEGQSFASKDLKGKVVVLNFWFVGCAPCIVEIPGLNRLVKELEGRDVVFLALALDGPKTLRSFLREKPFDYHIVPAAAKIAKEFEVSTYPTHVLIDGEGRIRHVLTGGNETRHEDLRRLIERMF